MNTYDLTALAAEAVSASPDRPAMAVIHDSPEARLVLFRLEPGQRVAPHASTSTVILSVIAGAGFLSGGEGGEHSAHAGDAVVFANNERHGMRALSDHFVVLAIIVPRPAPHPT